MVCQLLSRSQKEFSSFNHHTMTHPHTRREPKIFEALQNQPTLVLQPSLIETVNCQFSPLSHSSVAATGFHNYHFSVEPSYLRFVVSILLQTTESFVLVHRIRRSTTFGVGDCPSCTHTRNRKRQKAGNPQQEQQQQQLWVVPMPEEQPFIKL